LHAAQQTIAMLDGDTGEVVERTLAHDGETVREFYASIPRPAVVGIEATGSMGWFLQLLEELRIPSRVGHPAAVRKAETRRQKHDRRDADLLLKLLAEDRFPAIWMSSIEQRDLRALLLHRHQWVRMRTRVQQALQAVMSASTAAQRTRRDTFFAHAGCSGIFGLRSFVEQRERFDNCHALDADAYHALD
jgi:transposase